MTNKEKAKNIVGIKPLSSMITATDFEKLAVEMAEWKDKQFEYALRKAFMCTECASYMEKDSNCYDCEQHRRINEIIKHMSAFNE